MEMDIAGYIDHTLLKADATEEQVKQLCREAREYHFASVCVNSCHTELVTRELLDSGVKTCVVVGFPLGASLSGVKAFEAMKLERITAAKRSSKGWPKIYYATQIAVNPITILMFVNERELFEENYLRFVVNRLRSMLPVEEVPIRLLTRRHRQ